MENLVLTVLGDDRPGLVDTLSGMISAHGGSWQHSQMARLGGKFAGIVQVTVPAARVDELLDAFHGLGMDGVLHVTADRSGAEPAPDGHHFELSMVGTDQPGLVHAVAAALAAVGASIEELTTTTVEAPMSGGPLFTAHAVVVLPVSVDIAAVQAQLEDLAGHLMVDIDLTE